MEDANAIFENIFSLPCKVSEGKKNNLDKAISKMIFINFALGANVTVHQTELGKACNTVAYAPLSS